MASMPPNTISGDGGDATKSTEPQSPQQPLFQQQISGAETQQPNNVTGVPNLDGDTPVKVEGI